MRMNRLLASLLALMMVFSLLPAFSLTASAEDKGTISLVENESEGQITVAGEAPEAEEEEGLWIGNVKVTEDNASSLLNGAAQYDFATNTLTFTKQPKISGTHNDAMIDARTATVLTINMPGRMDLEVGNAAIGIYAENGLVVNGGGELFVDVFYTDGGIGIQSVNGPVTINGSFMCMGDTGGILCTGGDVKLTGGFSFTAPGDNGFGIKQSGTGGVDIGGYFDLGISNLGISATGPVHIGGAVSMKGGGGLCGIVTTSGGVVCDSSVTIKGNPASGGINAGESEEGIYIGGNVDISTGNSSKTPVLNAAGGPITVSGNLSIPAGCGQQCVYANGDITVTGNATIKNGYPYNSSSSEKGMAMMSKEGSIHVTGDCYFTSSGTSVYAANDILVEGTAYFRFGRTRSFDYGVKAETGAVSVDDKLEVYGTAQYMVFAQTGITVNGDVTIGENTSSGPISGSYGLYTDGAITHAAGAWDVKATVEALHAAQGITIGDGYGVVYPRGGLVKVLDGYTTVTEDDGATIAKHAFIDDHPAVILTFDAAGGTIPYDTVALPYGSNYTTPPWPTREGNWVFLGWYLNPGEGTSAGTGERLTSKVVFTENTTLYFHWRLPGDVNGDGMVDTGDVVRLAQYVKADGKDVIIVPNSADVNGDGGVDTADVVRLAQYVKADGNGVVIY